MQKLLYNVVAEFYDGRTVTKNNFTFENEEGFITVKKADIKVLHCNVVEPQGC